MEQKLALQNTMALKLKAGEVPEGLVEGYRHSLTVAFMPGNCVVKAVAHEACERAQKAGRACYVRCWHWGEVGYFIIDMETYCRIDPLTLELIARP